MGAIFRSVSVNVRTGIKKVFAIIKDQQGRFGAKEVDQQLSVWNGADCVTIPNTEATVCAKSSWMPRGASSASQTPSAYFSKIVPPTFKEIRVLPTPPDPVSVTRRCVPINCTISTCSFSRPIKVVSEAGRL